MNIQTWILDRVKQAMQAAHLPYSSLVQVRRATHSKFGDYQINGIMALANQLSKSPHELAQQILAYLKLPQAERIEIAGPGFINIFLAHPWLAQLAEQMLADPRLCVTLAPRQTIVVDYSGPNVAKEMAVHHIRSTLIGDAIVRILQFLGHKVLRANHIGDWGTQFGMLIAYMDKIEQAAIPDLLKLEELEEFYRLAKLRYDTDPQFAAMSRDYVVKLQQGENSCLAQWRKLVNITMEQNQIIYKRLGVLLTLDDVMGESFYNPLLAPIVADLIAKKIAVKSQGAWVVFLDELNNKQGEPLGVIIQKSDGGFLYTTTDIACVKYRCADLGADRILYYVDARQQQHLQQAWSIARKAGYIPKHVSIEHHAFGMMLDRYGKPFKTRAGKTIKLTALLDEAVERARKMVQDKTSCSFMSSEQEKVVHTLAIGAIKYADLCKHRATNYCFDWDHMLSLEGNTAPYLLYAYSRIVSLFERAHLDITAKLSGRIVITETFEDLLVLNLLQFEEIVYQVAQDGLPHLLCNYLYELAGSFSKFYENCPVLTAKTSDQRHSRLKLAALTALILQKGLSLLGISTVKRM